MDSRREDGDRQDIPVPEDKEDNEEIRSCPVSDGSSHGYGGHGQALAIL